MTRKFEETKYIGKRYNHLVFLRDTGKRQSGAVIAEFQCDCGAIVERFANPIINLKVLSCGCANKRLDHDEIIRLYVEEKRSTTYIAKLFKAHNATIRNVLKYKGIERRDHSESTKLFHNTTLDENVFDDINEFSAYWIGFLLCDATISGESRIQLELSPKDKDHLEKFKLFVNGSQKIVELHKKQSICGKYTSVIYSFQSKHMVSKLSEYYIVPRKTGTEEAHISLQNNKHFWRGVLDGDVWVSIHKGRLYIGICGSEKLCNQFLDYCKTIDPSIINKVAVNQMYLTYI